VFAFFARSKREPALVAMMAVVFLLIIQVLDIRDALKVFSNPAPIAVGCMFVLSAALERTGVIDNFGQGLSSYAEKSPLLSIIGIMFAVMFVSAFMNNTPVVVIMTPVVITLARRINIAPSKLLIPLSYLTILGGNTTLLGTSTNLLVDGVATDMGLAPFGIFEATLPALALLTVGVVYLVLFGRFLLPNRDTLSSVIADASSQRKFMTEVLIPTDSQLIGKKIDDISILKSNDYELIDILRDDASLRYELDGIEIESGDRLILKTNIGEVVGLREKDFITFGDMGDHAVEPISSRENPIIEGIVGPNSKFVGQQIGDLNLRRLYGIYILAVHREKENIRKNFDKIRLAFGDTLLVQGSSAGLKKLFDSKDLINLSETAEKPFKRSKAPIAVAAISLVMGLASFKVMPIVALAFIAAFLVIAFGCLDLDEAYEAIEWRILMLIFGMLAISVAMQNTGAGKFLVDNILSLLQGAHPIVILSVVYFLTSLLTEMVSNNAAAVLITPIAIGIAQQIGVDPRAFAIAVMFGASASFATPIGYQTNTFVYSAGGYKFTDFVKIGLPMNILMWLTATLIIPLIYF